MSDEIYAYIDRGQIHRSEFKKINEVLDIIYLHYNSVENVTDVLFKLHKKDRSSHLYKKLKSSHKFKIIDLLGILKKDLVKHFGLLFNCDFSFN